VEAGDSEEDDSDEDEGKGEGEDELEDSFQDALETLTLDETPETVAVSG
jgi:hypothetical protein